MRSALTLRLAAAVLLAASAAHAQEAARTESAPGAPAQSERPRPEARKVDDYGNIGHCDWSARLDNFAIELQNDPGARGLVVSYDSPGRHSYASRHLRSARHYMVESRGIDPSRLVLVEGGVREDLKAGQTELWLVPEGAEPPVAQPAENKYAQGFSGKFDTFVTDPNVYEEVSEMSTPDSAIARSEFASKLKQQPESVGYVVVRAPAHSLPGAWRRFARRDEQLLRRLGVDAPRVRTLDGGQASGDGVEIDLWVLPAWAPPPPSVAEKLEPTFKAAARLHTLDVDAEVDEDAERWMLENLADFLRDNPRATALLVAREPTPQATEEGGDAESPDAAQTSEEATEEGTEEAEESPAGGAAAEPLMQDFETVKELAEIWKKELASKYGVEAHRVTVVEGRKVAWGVGRLNLWVIPEKGKWPDPQAADEDEAEREQYYGVAPETEAAETPR